VHGKAPIPGSEYANQLEEVSIRLPPGRYYRRMWVAPVALLLLFALVATLGQISPLSFASAPDYLGILLFIGLVCLLSMGLPLYFRVDRQLFVDGEGVRLYRGSRQYRFLPWSRVTRVQYGPLTQNLGVLGRYRGFELLIRGPRNASSILVFDALFDIPEGELLGVAIEVGNVAAKQSVPVIAKPFRWPYG
jgi:hypothetical protein